MFDLDRVGSNVVLVRGGLGGSYLSHNCEGQKGQRGVFTFELKLIADAGLVG